MTANAQPMVHVVDDDDSVRRSLVSLLEEVGVPVATFPSAEAFLQALHDDGRGCILLDVRMPGMSGLQLQQELRERGVTMPTIILTGHADVPMAVGAMSAGAAGFVEKPFHPQELLDRIHDCIEADSRQAAVRAERRQAGDALARLSSREQEVLRQLVTGKPSKLIASALGISEKTVDVHRSNLMRKTGTRSVAELMRLWFLLHPVEEQLDHDAPSHRPAPLPLPHAPRTTR
jgi:two-component system, LuxR family, response regulator FixJ